MTEAALKTFDACCSIVLWLAHLKTISMGWGVWRCRHSHEEEKSVPKVWVIWLRVWAEEIRVAGTEVKVQLPFAGEKTQTGELVGNE